MQEKNLLLNQEDGRELRLAFSAPVKQQRMIPVTLILIG
jgi:hypothetical protein